MNHAVRKRVLRVSSPKVLNFLSLHDAKAQSQSLSSKFSFKTSLLVVAVVVVVLVNILLAFFDKYRETLCACVVGKVIDPDKKSIK